MSEPREESCAVKCRQVLIDGYAALGVEANVSTTPPLFNSGYETLNLRCPHGVLWYAEPTTEQVARWAAEGVA